jgi:hypothetical protein
VRARRLDFSPLSPATTINEVDFGRTTYTSGSSIPNTPVDDDEYKRKSKLGLRVPEIRFDRNASPERSPGGERLARAEKGESVRRTSSPKRHADDKKQKGWKRGAVKPWRLEIMSWLLSALCMCTIAAVLYLFQDRPLPKHWLMGITLNAYLSILSRAASAALMLSVSEALGQLKWSWFQGRSKKLSDFEMFDNASRGPWGSFILLIRTKGRTLAALGAVVTICALVMDPFFQQVVRYPQRTVLQIHNNSIAIATRLESWTYTEEGQVQLYDPDRELHATVGNYFTDMGVPEVQVGNGTRAEIPLSCPTSNCTWESYETLGVCSACVDVVDKLEFDCRPGILDWVKNATSYNPYENGTMCGWFLNAVNSTDGANTTLMLGYQVDLTTNRPSGEVLTTRALPLITNISRKRILGGSINFKHIRNPINNFIVVSSPGGPDQESILRSIFQRERPQALECVLSFCVKTINSAYNEAMYTEVVTNHFINTTAGPYPWTIIPPPRNAPDPTSKGYMHYYQNITVDPHASDGQGNTSTFGLGNDTAVNIITIFDDFLPSFYTRPKNSSTIWLKHQTWDKTPMLRENPKNPWAAPNNVTLHLETLATAMTNRLRQWGNNTALGKTFSEETYIEVRWEWLILPVIVLILALFFLLGTIWRTSAENGRVGVWKNSSIVTLLYGLPDELQWKLTASSHHHEKPQSRAKELKVRLLPTKKWRMSGYILSPTTDKPKSRPDWM